MPEGRHAVVSVETYLAAGGFICRFRPGSAKADGQEAESSRDGAAHPRISKETASIRSLAAETEVKALSSSLSE